MREYRLRPSASWSQLFTSFGYVQDLGIEELSGLRYHIEHQKYFGSLATVISLIQQQPDMRKETERMLLDETLTLIVEELKYLQKEYVIIKRSEMKNKNA